MKLSIIIPVYKVEKYLPKCLESCLRQDMQPDEYEMICVNDGSPDNCGQILDDYVARNPNIRVITQENKGLSIARNNGLAVATGEYVWFVDSDDSIVEGCLKDIIVALDSNPDLLQLNYQLTYEDGQDSIRIISSFGDKNRVTGQYAIANGCLPTPAQFTIYRKDFLKDNKLRFYPGIYHEDSEFKPRATYFANSVEWHTPVVYNYLQRDSGSITSSFKLKNGIDYITVMNHLHDFYLTHVKETECIYGFRRQISMIMNSIFIGIRNLNSDDRGLLLTLLKKQKHLFKDMRHSNKIKYAIEGLMMQISPSLALTLHKIIK